MKNKILTLMLALTMIFTLAACGEKASLTLEKTEITLSEEGATANLTAVTTGKKVETVTFKSSDESVATVDANGKVTAVAPGTATITASAAAGKETLTATATVKCEWTVKVDLTAFYENLAKEYGEEFPANANVVEFGMLPDMYPGLDAISTEQLLVFQPMMGAVVCEIALVETTDAADVAKVKEILQTRIDAQIDGGAWYPESIEGWEKNSRIVENGNYVMMIAWNYCDEAVEAFNALF